MSFIQEFLENISNPTDRLEAMEWPYIQGLVLDNYDYHLDKMTHYLCAIANPPRFQSFLRDHHQFITYANSFCRWNGRDWTLNCGLTYNGVMKLITERLSDDEKSPRISGGRRIPGRGASW